MSTRNPTPSKRALYIYITELIFQCSMVLRAADDLNEAIDLNQLAIDAGDREGQEAHGLSIWLSLQALVGAGARASQLVFPGGLPKKPEPADIYRVQRGVEVQALLVLPDDSLLKDKSLRNSLEHFDERIDKWARSSRAPSYVSKTLGSLDRVRGLERQDVMRQYDPATNVASFQGRDLNIQDLVTAIDQVKVKAEQALVHMGA